MDEIAKAPVEGEVWRHFKGGRYRILHLAAAMADGSAVVVYQLIRSGAGVRTRPLGKFVGVVKRDGYHGPRFVREGPEQPPTPDQGDPRRAPRVSAWTAKMHGTVRGALFRLAEIQQRGVETGCFVQEQMDLTTEWSRLWLLVEEAAPAMVAEIERLQEIEAAAREVNRIDGWTPWATDRDRLWDLLWPGAAGTAPVDTRPSPPEWCRPQAGTRTFEEAVEKRVGVLEKDLVRLRRLERAVVDEPGSLRSVAGATWRRWLQANGWKVREACHRGCGPRWAPPSGALPDFAVSLVDSVQDDSLRGVLDCVMCHTGRPRAEVLAELVGMQEQEEAGKGTTGG
jgi:hypothetical protein